MRSHAWSSDIREVVVSASRFGMSPTMIEAITGVSQRSIQRIVSEPKRGDDRRRSRHNQVLGIEYRGVR